jgi:phage terminase large subunit-like protein
MSSATVAPSDLAGEQRPRICTTTRRPGRPRDVKPSIWHGWPAWTSIPWQEFVLDQALGERADGRWAAFEVGLVVSRQNGKGAILEARELAGLFLLGERLLIHSAHQFDTSLEAFRRLLFLIEDTPTSIAGQARLARPRRGGHRAQERAADPVRTRTKGGGRGFTGDCLILDEAMILPESRTARCSRRCRPARTRRSGTPEARSISRSMSTASCSRGSGSAACDGDDPRLAYFEWSADRGSPDDVTEDVASDPDVWAAANPGLGIRISTDHVATERRSMDPRTFAVERLGAGDWPNDLDNEDGIDPETWAALTDEASVALDPVWFAFDVRPDRSSSAVGVAGKRPDGLGASRARRSSPRHRMGRRPARRPRP